jgi:hypothetical protein
MSEGEMITVHSIILKHCFICTVVLEQLYSWVARIATSPRMEQLQFYTKPLFLFFVSFSD